MAKSSLAYFANGCTLYNALGMIILHESVYSLSMTQNSGETQCATHQLPECPFVIGRTQGLVGRSILRAGLWQLLFGSLEMASGRQAR